MCMSVSVSFHNCTFQLQKHTFSLFMMVYIIKWYTICSVSSYKFSFYKFNIKCGLYTYLDIHVIQYSKWMTSSFHINDHLNFATTNFSLFRIFKFSLSQICSFQFSNCQDWFNPRQTCDPDTTWGWLIYW